MSSRRSEQRERVSGSIVLVPEASYRARTVDPDTRCRSCGMTARYTASNR
jgi:RNase P subunit RPR2